MELLSGFCVELGVRLREEELPERVCPIELPAALERFDPAETELEEFEGPRL